MMATFLEGVQALADEVGLPSLPTTTSGQIGEFRRLVNWYKQAWVEIQNRLEWRFMQRGFTLSTIDEFDSYDPSDAIDSSTEVGITRFGRWRFEDRVDMPRIYLASSGIGTQTYLNFLPWETFKAIYKIGTQNTGYPAHISYDIQDNIRLGPIPNGVYTVTGDYYRSAQILEDDEDIPEMPTQYHYLIVYEAMKKYGLFESASEVVARANMESAKLMRQLERNQASKIRIRKSFV